MAIKCAIFVSLSTMHQIALFFHWVNGKPSTKLMDPKSHFHSGTSRVCRSPAGCWCLIFTRWQVRHFATYSAISYFMLPYQNVRFRPLYSLFPPGCTECGVLWPSSRIFFLSAPTARMHNRLWKQMVPSSWITNSSAFPTNISSLIGSSWGFIAWATRISSMRVGCTSKMQSIGLALGVITLSSNFRNSSHNSFGSASKQLSTGYGRRLNASATTLAFSRWYWKWTS